MISPETRNALKAERKRMLAMIEKIDAIVDDPDVRPPAPATKTIAPRQAARRAKKKTTTVRKAKRSRRPIKSRATVPAEGWARGRTMFEEQGKTTKQVAEKLGCTESAVKNHKYAEGWEVKSVTCPNCERYTTMDPCEHCHSVLPKAVANRLAG